MDAHALARFVKEEVPRIRDIQQPPSGEMTWDDIEMLLSALTATLDLLREAEQAINEVMSNTKVKVEIGMREAYLRETPQEQRAWLRLYSVGATLRLVVGEERP